MSVRSCSPRRQGAALRLAAAIVLASIALLPTLPAPTAQGALLTVGEGSSPGLGLPSLKIELPPLTGGSSGTGVSVEKGGVTVTTPVTPPVTVPLPEVPSPAVQSPPPAEEPASEASGGAGGSTGGGSSGGGSSGGGGSGGSGPVTATTASTATSASAPSAGSGPAGTGAGSTSGSAGAGRHARHSRRRASASSSPGGGGPATSLTAAAAGAPGHKSGPSSAHPSRHSSSGDPLSSLGSSLPLPLPVPDWSKPIILALVLLALAFGLRWGLVSRRARRLERTQEALLRDMEVMQAALVPEVPPQLSGLDVSVAYRPAEGPAAGGDFYDVFETEEGRVAVILGDVAGHGHDAVRQAALTRYTLRAFLKETGDPRTTLALAGHALSEPGCEQFATVAIAIYDPAAGSLTYALAGHPPPLLLGVPCVEAPAACSSPPVGCELPTGRRQRTVSLPAGARACFFSDGLVEARLESHRNEGHPALLGRDRLAELLAELPDGGGAPELLAAVRREASATPDDMAACIFGPAGGRPRGILDVEELELDTRTIREGHLDVYLYSCGLDTETAAHVIEEARARLETQSLVLLAVDRSGGAVEITVRDVSGRPRTPAPAAGLIRGL